MRGAPLLPAQPGSRARRRCQGQAPVGWPAASLDPDASCAHAHTKPESSKTMSARPRQGLDRPRSFMDDLLQETRNPRHVRQALRAPTARPPEQIPALDDAGQRWSRGLGGCCTVRRTVQVWCSGRRCSWGERCEVWMPPLRTFHSAGQGGPRPVRPWHPPSNSDLAAAV